MLDENVFTNYWKARLRKSHELVRMWEIVNQDKNKQYEVVNLMTIAPYMPLYSTKFNESTMKVADTSLKIV